jgi:hypothetical protein
MNSDMLSLAIAAGILTVGGISLMMVKQNNEQEPEPEEEKSVLEPEYLDDESLGDFVYPFHFAKPSIVPRKSMKKTHNNRRQYSSSKRRY